jgi:hypothetical protein
LYGNAENTLRQQQQIITRQAGNANGLNTAAPAVATNGKGSAI